MRHSMPSPALYAMCLSVALAACGSSRESSSGAPVEVPPATSLCGAQDTPETGIQGDSAAASGNNCGLSLLNALTVSGAVQGYQNCAYVRTASDRVEVYDLGDPLAPELTSTLTPAGSDGGGGTSETLRVIAPNGGSAQRALLISGSSIYDIREDCAHPVHKGDVAWPGILPWPAGLSHDVRISHDGRKVYASIGVVIADISDLDHPETWTVKNQTCNVAAAYHPLHSIPAAFDISLCNVPVANNAPQLSHGPDDNDAGTRLYVGNQGIPASVWIEQDTLRLLDITVDPPRILDVAPGPGHSIDWFRSADGREYILHANELVFVPQTSCAPHPRPSSLGWAFEAFITEVTGDKLVRKSMLELDINKPENCAAKLASSQNTQIAYHSVDNPYKASFAMISMGSAGLRLFDIRDPAAPHEVAYFNSGALVHAGSAHYDAARGLVYMPGGNAMQILELQPQVIAALGLARPSDPAYPRFPNGRPTTP